MSLHFRPSSKRARLSQQADEGAEDDDEEDDDEEDDEEDDDDDEGDENDDQLGTDLSIREQEELALKLLQS